MALDLVERLMESRDWELQSITKNEELPEVLCKVALNLKAGQPYTEVKIIPAEEVMKNSKWRTKEPSHFIYGKLSEDRIREKDSEKYIVFIDAECCPIGDKGDIEKGRSEIIALGHYSGN